jgi:hypothetical protein
MSYSEYGINAKNALPRISACAQMSKVLEFFFKWKPHLVLVQNIDNLLFITIMQFRVNQFFFFAFRYVNPF